MKTNIKRKFLFILLFILFGAGCGSVLKDKSENVSLSTDPFVGDWLVTDFKIKKIPSREFINAHVTITTNGKYYYISGLDGAIEKTVFIRHRNRLEGDYLPDMKHLKTVYPETPPALLSHALGDVKYHCSIVFDGRGLIAESANAQIRSDMNGIYLGYTPLNGYFSWFLEKR